MPNTCTPLEECKNLDGRLLLQRTIYGPQFGFAQQANLLGVPAAGAGVRPYVDLTLGMTWSQVGLCQGPPVSVMALAPGEVVTVGIRTRSSRSFSQLVSDAAESSNTSSHSWHQILQQGTQPVPPASGSGGGTGGGFLGDLGSIFETAVQLAPVLISVFGSIWEDVVSVAEGVASGAADIATTAVGAITDLLDKGIIGPLGDGGTGSSAVGETSSMTNDILDTVTRSESQSYLRQSTFTTAEETEQTIKRTFGNPYLDRSLQLRLMPVFNEFQVRVELWRITPGLVVHFSEPASSLPIHVEGGKANVRSGMLLRAVAAERAPALRPVATALYVTNQAGDSDGVRRPMRDVLRGLSRQSDTSALLEHGLSWSRTEIRGNGVHVPLSSPENLISAWNLKDASANKLNKSFSHITPKRWGEIFKVLTRTVSVFAGTHIEAVPGSCVLPDIPADLKVIVPGETQYIRGKD